MARLDKKNRRLLFEFCDDEPDAANEVSSKSQSGNSSDASLDDNSVNSHKQVS